MNAFNFAVTQAKVLRNTLQSGQFKFSALFLTTRCNILCPYCWIPTKERPELSTTQWKQVIDKLAGWGVVHFSLLGGEPLLREDLEEIVSHISSKGRVATVTTNGMLLPDDRLENLSRSGLYTLVVSLDRLSGPIKGDPDLAFSLLTQAKSKGIIPIMHCVITSKNIKDVPILARDATRRGFFFSCSVYQSIGGIQSRPLDKLVPENEEIMDVFSQIQEIKRKTGLVRTTYAYMRNFPKYSGAKWHCDPAKSSWIVVQSDGALLACTEWETGASVFDIQDVNTEEFYQLRKTATDKCAGCYYECYFSEEEVFGQGGSHLLAEIPTGIDFWKHLLRLLWNKISLKPTK